MYSIHNCGRKSSRTINSGQTESTKAFIQQGLFKSTPIWLLIILINYFKIINLGLKKNTCSFNYELIEQYEKL